MESFLEGILAGYGIAIPVGAVAILIVNMSLQCGFRIGFFAGAGAATADFLYALLASLAGAVLGSLLRPYAIPLRLLSGGVLAFMAVSMFRRGWKDAGIDEGSAQVCGPWRMYFQFLGITFINPLTVVYFTALILGSGRTIGPDPLSSAQFVLGVGVASLSWQTLLAGLGGMARDRLPGAFRRVTTLVGSLLVLALALRALLSAL